MAFPRPVFGRQPASIDRWGPAARVLWIGQASESLTAMLDDLRRLEVVVDVAEGRGTSLAYADAHAYDLILLDDHTGSSSQEYLSLLSDLVVRHPNVPVAISTSAASYLGSVASIKLGAFGYVETPRTVDALLVLLHRAQEWQAAQRAGAGRG